MSIMTIQILILLNRKSVVRPSSTKPFTGDVNVSLKMTKLPRRMMIQLPVVMAGLHRTLKPFPDSPKPRQIAV